ncbi:MAG: rhodanese-like domain-containing protein [Gemmatimonadales bacterium]|nr:MAG: rhodanese-like domain-containing protein [Gemmatimonadales bacterium]
MSLLSRFRSRELPSSQPPSSSPVELDAGEFLRRRSPDAPILDVRTPGEFSQGHLVGAKNLDIMGDDFLEGVERLGLDREAPVYLYCRSGNRSGTAARLLRENGYTQAYNVGAFEELARAGAPAAS